MIKVFWNLVVSASKSHQDGSNRNYTGYQVLRTIPQNQKQVEFLTTRIDFGEEYLFWSEIGLGHDVDIMVSAGQKQKFIAELDLMNIKHRIMIADVGEQMRI